MQFVLWRLCLLFIMDPGSRGWIIFASLPHSRPPQPPALLNSVATVVRPPRHLVRWVLLRGAQICQEPALPEVWAEGVSQAQHLGDRLTVSQPGWPAASLARPEVPEAALPFRPLVQLDTLGSGRGECLCCD